MTAGELIAFLSEFPAETPVYLYDYEQIARPGFAAAKVELSNAAEGRSLYALITWEIEEKADLQQEGVSDGERKQ